LSSSNHWFALFQVAERMEIGDGLKAGSGKAGIVVILFLQGRD
jgi:hypothetical protein